MSPSGKKLPVAIAKVLCLALGLTASAGAQNGGEDPNILLIFTDDTSSYATSPYGDPLASTPILDQLAAAGTVFNRGFANSIFCKPARNTLFSGLYPHEHGWLTNHVVLPVVAPTIFMPELLRNDGYTTFGVGKWHSSFTPDDAGFDVFLAPSDPVNTARSFLYQMQDADDPWFLYVSLNQTHGPWLDLDSHQGGEPLRQNVNLPRSNKPVAQNFFQQTGFDKLARQGLDPDEPREPVLAYYQEATSLDADVERLLRRLYQLGMEENTLVIFTSDQGVMAGNHYLWYKGPAAYDEMVQVPFLASWPAESQGGSFSDAYISTVDIAPTILDAAGITIPASFSGRSHLNVLKDQGFNGDKFVVIQSAKDDPLSGQIRAIRTYPNRVIPGEWKLVLNENDIDELYKIGVDPYESTNLSNHPNYQDEYEALRNQLLVWMFFANDPAYAIFQ